MEEERFEVKRGWRGGLLARRGCFDRAASSSCGNRQIIASYPSPAGS